MRNSRIELKLGGQVRSLLFSHVAFDLLTKDGPLEQLDELALTKPWRYLPTLATAALQAAAEFEGKKDKFTYNQVAGWIDEVEDPMEINKVHEAYKTALGFTYHATFGRDVLGEQREKLQKQIDQQSTGTNS